MITKANNLLVRWLFALVLGAAYSYPALAHSDEEGYWHPYHHHHRHHNWRQPYYGPVQPAYYPPAPVYAPGPPRNPPPPQVTIGIPPMRMDVPLPPLPGWR